MAIAVAASSFERSGVHVHLATEKVRAGVSRAALLGCATFVGSSSSSSSSSVVVVVVVVGVVVVVVVVIVTTEHVLRSHRTVYKIKPETLVVDSDHIEL